MKDFLEQNKLEKVLDRLSPYASIERLATVYCKRLEFPIYGIVLGAREKGYPTFGLFGGVHGLEKIGAQLVISHLDYLANQLSWDTTLQDILKKSRIVSIPIVNPVGTYFNRRSNGNGVDIMRNGPVSGKVDTKNLLSGHRIGPWLPWFQGFEDNKREIETKAMMGFVKSELFESSFSMSLDVHSGFGLRDRLWYPYSRSREEFPLYSRAMAFKRLMKGSTPYHVYKVESQSDSYLINGDPWDYLFDFHYQMHKGKQVYIPWTLEMGSWRWVRKNPKQLFSYSGIFNPMIPHRYNRVMRRHRPLLELFHKAALNHESWG